MTATLLFDLDGTLVETDHLHFKAFRTIFTPLGVAIDWDLYRQGFIGRANSDIAAAFLPHIPAERHAAIMDSKEAAYRDLVTTVEEASGLSALLDWAEARGIRCGVVTNAPRANAELLLKALRLEHRFATLIIGAELERSKPDPLPYRRALEVLGGDAAHSVAFEDSPSGAVAAVAAELGVVGLVTSVEASDLLGVGVSIVARDYTDPAVLAYVRERTAAA